MIIPSKGRIVLYTSKAGKTRPAIIVEVWTDPKPTSAVNLQVFTDRSNDGQDPEFAHASAVGLYWVTSACQAETETPGKWHVPPHVPALPAVPTPPAAG